MHDLARQRPNIGLCLLLNNQLPSTCIPLYTLLLLLSTESVYCVFKNIKISFKINRVPCSFFLSILVCGIKYISALLQLKQSTMI